MNKLNQRNFKFLKFLLVVFLLLGLVGTGCEGDPGSSNDNFDPETENEPENVVQDTLNLGSTSRFAILSRSGINNIGESEINGDIGISPGVSADIAGFNLSADASGEFSTAEGINGSIYAADYAGATPGMLTTAEQDAIAAYDNSLEEERGNPTELTGDLNEQQITPGLYEAENIELSEGGIFTLDAEGNPDGVFIIRNTSSFNTAEGSEVVLTGDAQPENVYWVSDADVNLGPNSQMYGTIISSRGFNMHTGSNLYGRILLQGQTATEVSLNESTITNPGF